MADSSNILGSIMRGIGSLLGGDDTNFVQKMIRGVQMYEAAKSPFTHADQGSLLGMNTGSGGAKLSLASVLVGGSFDAAAVGFAGENVHALYEKVQKKEMTTGQAVEEGISEAARAGGAMWAFRAMGGNDKDAGFFKKLGATIGAIVVGKAADLATDAVLHFVPLDKAFGGNPAISGGQSVTQASTPHTPTTQAAAGLGQTAT